MKTDRSVPKTIVFGFDALDFRYLDRFQDDLPNFKSLREGGQEAALESTFPPWTGSAWPSMYTGTDPSHHGVYDFFQYDDYPDNGKIVSRNDVEMPAVWNYLTAEGIPSIVMNVPVTHPAEPIEGALIPGYLAQEEANGYPNGIRDEIADKLGEEYRIYSRAEMSEDSDEKFSGYLDLIDLRKRAAVHLLSDKDWQLAIIQVQKTDAVFHGFDDQEAFRRVYKAADEMIGTVLDSVSDPVNVVVCSDHGIGPTQGYRIYVNEVLRDHGYIATTNDQSGPSLAGEKSRLVGQSETTETSLQIKAASRMIEVLRQVGLTPNRLYKVAENLGIASKLLDTGMRDVIQRTASEGVDYRRSIAYCPRRTRMGVRINLQGREPDGVVEPEEYESVRSDIIDILSGLKTPDGKNAFEFVDRYEERQDGPLSQRGPDILLGPRGMNNAISPSLYGCKFLEIDKYDHKFDGVFLGSGPSFSSDFEDDRLSLTDVSPIIMALLGLPVPTRMTGEVPPELLKNTIREDAYDDVKYGHQDHIDDDNNTEVTERLEDLGYL